MSGTEKNTFFEQFLEVCSIASNNDTKNYIYYLYPMAHLAKQYNLKNYVQLGINKRQWEFIRALNRL